MKISIIVPIFNAENTLDKCIQSIIKQTYHNIEVILINDGSTDNSGNICIQYKKLDKRIKYYKTPNQGVSHARNLGIEKSTGIFICFVDSDDIIDKNFCELLQKNIVKNNAQLAACGYKITRKLDNNSIISNIASNTNIEVVTDKKVEYLFKEYKGFLWNKMYLKSIIKEKQIKLDEKIYMCEDLLFNFEYLKYVNKVAYIDNKLYVYYISKSNASIAINNKWFTVLEVYKKIYYNIKSYNKMLKIIFYYNYLLTLYEAKIRCSILDINFKNLLSKKNINLNEIENSLKGNLVFSPDFTLYEKVRFFMYKDLGFIIKKIKFKK